MHTASKDITHSIYTNCHMCTYEALYFRGVHQDFCGIIIVVHNRDQPEIFQIECTPKAAFQALYLSIKHSRSFPSVLKIDQVVL